jgi:hypothetical protein
MLRRMDQAHLHALLGGALIGGAASLLLLALGRVAGISNIAGAVVRRDAGDGSRDWRLAFLAGLLAAGAVAALVAPAAIGTPPVSLPVVAVAGLVVGVGARLGNGCTSGHGVCGISRGAPRSLAATVVFMATGMLTAVAVGALGGAS